MTNVSMIFKTLAISTALSAGWLMLPGAASANGCPPGTDWWNGSCVSNPTTGGGDNTNTNTATGGNATGVGVGVGVGTGIGHGGAGGAGGQGGNATGGRGGNSSVRGSGNSSSRSGVSGSGNSQQSQSAINGGNTVNIKNGVAAAMAAPSSLAVCDGEYAQSSFGTTILTANITKCVKDRFEQVIIAEDLYVTQGRTWGAIYLAGKDNGINNKTRQLGITETSGDLSQRRKAERDAATQTRFGAPVHAGSEPMAARQIAPATTQTVRCPAGSSWDGRGCWMPAR